MPNIVKIENIVNIRAGFTFRSRPDADVNGTAFLVQQKNVNDSRTAICFDGAMLFTPDRDMKAHWLQDGDVLFMGKGHSIFGCIVNNPPGDTVAVGLFFVLSLNQDEKERVLPEYLAWFLNRKATRDELLKVSGSGVSMPVVRRKVLESLEIPLPSLETQQRIVDLNQLLVREKNLMKELTEKRGALAHAVCENLIKGENL